MAIEAVLFDVFGTVVDWRSSLVRQFQSFGGENDIAADWTRLIDDWRAEYRPSMDAVRTGRRAWTSLESLHRESLDRLLPCYGLKDALSDSQKQDLVRGWHFLDPWPDAAPALTRLKRKFIIGTLSNGGLRLLVDMARYAGLPWDVIFSSDQFQHFKPDAEVYRNAVDLLWMAPENVLLVAAHNYDLMAARKHGMKTAFVARPTEYGPRQSGDWRAESNWDFVADDFGKLADQIALDAKH
jgi:2-haloacid dehalogenase